MVNGDCFVDQQYEPQNQLMLGQWDQFTILSSACFRQLRDSNALPDLASIGVKTEREIENRSGLFMYKR